MSGLDERRTQALSELAARQQADCEPSDHWGIPETEPSGGMPDDPWAAEIYLANRHFT